VKPCPAWILQKRIGSQALERRTSSTAADTLSLKSINQPVAVGVNLVPAIIIHNNDLTPENWTRQKKSAVIAPFGLDFRLRSWKMPPDHE
jgi:hypothetical protein